MKYVRRCITIPQDLTKKIDKARKKMYMNRSQFMVQALVHYLNESEKCRVVPFQTRQEVDEAINIVEKYIPRPIAIYIS